MAKGILHLSIHGCPSEATDGVEVGLKLTGQDKPPAHDLRNTLDILCVSLTEV